MKLDQEVIGIDELELRLSGTNVPDGEITFDRLAALANAMQGVAKRLGRHLTGQEGPGRSPATVERATELRLRGTSTGSTRLAIVVGEEDVLTEGLEHRVVDGLFEIFTGIADDRPPVWTTPLIGEAAVSLIDALAQASTECQLSGRHGIVRVAPRAASPAVWPGNSSTPEHRPGVAVSGRLELIDLRRSRFRIRDRAGNDIPLDRVANAEEVARLAGDVVTATGTATISAHGRVTGLTDAVVQATRLPDWTPPSLTEALAGAAPPPDDGIDGVGDDEIAEFLALIRE